MDNFAEEALLFEDSYSSAATTMPNHASIFTGRYPCTHGLISVNHLSLTQDTIGQQLRRKGYVTTGITSVGFLNQRKFGSCFRHVFVPKPRFKARVAERTVDEAIQYLDRFRLRTFYGDTKSLFLWVHLWDPHHPYAPPNPYDRQFVRDGLEEICRKGLADGVHHPETRILTPEEHEATISQYDGELAYMDEHIKRLVECLKTNGFYENSIIIFTADHGEVLFENENRHHGHETTYEPVAKIPLIIRHPDYGSERIRGLVQNIDIARTLADWLGFDKDWMDGRSLVRLIEQKADPRTEILLMNTYGRIVGVNDGRYKLRRVTCKRKESLPIPKQWASELSLPRIRIDPETPEEWDYEKCGGRVWFSWQDPLEVKGDIGQYALEALDEGWGPERDYITYFNSQGPRIVYHSWKTACRILWNYLSLTVPTHVRVVGKDEEGRVIASSEVMPLALKPTEGFEETELYDLRKDPKEKNNVARENPEKVAELMLKTEEYAKRYVDIWEKRKIVEEGPGMTKEEQEVMRSLGYF